MRKEIVTTIVGGILLGACFLTPALWFIIEFIFTPYSYFLGFELFLLFFICINIGIAIFYVASKRLGKFDQSLYQTRTTTPRSFGSTTTTSTPRGMSSPSGMMSISFQEIEEKRKRDRANYPGDPEGKQIHDQKVKELFDEANENFKKQNFLESKNLLEEAINIEPDVPDLYVQLGVSYFMLKEDQKGLAFLQKAIQLNPYHIRAFEILEKIYEGWGQSIKAEEIFQTLKSFGPMYVNYLCDLGFRILNSRDLSRGFKQNYQTAKSFFKRALLIDPNNKEAKFFLNQIETFDFIDRELDKFKGDYNRAVEYYRNQLKLNPNDRRAFALLRMAEMRQLGLDF